MTVSNSKILDLAEDILLEEDDFVVPIIKLNSLVVEQYQRWHGAPEELADLLDQDDRFRVIRSEEQEDPWSPKDDEIMKQLGCYRGPRVMLLRRMPTKEELVAALHEKMDKTLSALKKAYEAKPDDLTDEQEEEFLHIMEKTQHLQQTLREKFETD